MDQRLQDNLSVLREILEEDKGNVSKSEGKARDFYKSCMKGSEKSETSLHDIILDVGGWNLTGRALDMSAFDMRKKVLLVQKYTHSSLFKW